MKMITLLLLLLMILMSMGWTQTKQDTLSELMRKVDILTQEIEKQKLGEVAERKYEGKYGLGPAASQIYYRKEAGVSIAGYGEVVYENYADKKDDDSPGGRTDRIDYLRNIIYLGYKFNERFLFNSEVEFEHAFVEGDEESGEVAMEFGYIDAIVVGLLISLPNESVNPCPLLPINTDTPTFTPGTPAYSTLPAKARFSAMASEPLCLPLLIPDAENLAAFNPSSK